MKGVAHQEEAAAEAVAAVAEEAVEGLLLNAQKAGHAQSGAFASKTDSEEDHVLMIINAALQAASQKN